MWRRVIQVGVLLVAVLCLGAILLLQPQVDPNSPDVREYIGPSPLQSPSGIVPLPERLAREDILVLQRLLPLRDEHRSSRIYIFASFPTSGNEFVREFYSRGTDLSKATMYGREPNMIKFQHIIGNLDCYVDRGYPPPINGSTLMKTHHPHFFADSLENANLTEHFAGIVIQLRNPGDCLLRDAARWPCKYRPNAKKCEDDTASNYCNELKKKGEIWRNMYMYWIDKGEEYNLPVFIMRYEDTLLDPIHSMISLIQFVNEDDPDYIVREDWIAQKAQENEQFHLTYELGKIVQQCSAVEVEDLLDSIGPNILQDFGYQLDLHTKTFSWFHFQQIRRPKSKL